MKIHGEVSRCLRQHLEECDTNRGYFDVMDAYPFHYGYGAQQKLETELDVILVIQLLQPNIYWQVVQ